MNVWRVMKTGALVTGCLLGAALAGTARADSPGVKWLKGSLPYHREAPGRVVFSPDGSRFALPVQSFTEVRRTTDQQLLFTLPVTESDVATFDLFFTPDGGTIVTVRSTQDTTVSLWSADTGASLGRFVFPESTARVSPDGRVAVLADSSYDDKFSAWVSTLDVRSLSDGRTLYSLENILNWTLDPASGSLVVMRTDHTVQFLNLGDGSVRHEIPGSSLGYSQYQAFTGFSYSAAAGILLLETPERVDLRDAGDGQLIPPPPGQSGGMLLAGGKFLRTVTAEDPAGKKNVWGRIGDEWVPVTAPWAASPALTFTPDGGYVAASDGMTGRIGVWRTGDGQLVRAFDTSGTPLGITPDGQTLAIALPPDPDLSDNYSFYPITFWRVSDGQRLVPTYNFLQTVKSLAFSPDSRILATAGDEGDIRLWDASDGTLLQTWPKAGKPILELTFSPDGQTLYGRMYNGTHAWRVSDGQALPSVPLALNLTSPDGRYVAVMGGDPTLANTIEIRRADDHSLVQTLRTDQAGWFPLAFTADSRGLLVQEYSTNYGDTSTFNYKVLDVSDGHLIRALATFPPGGSPPDALSDGRILVLLTTVNSPPGAEVSETYSLAVYRVSDGTLLRRDDRIVTGGTYPPFFGVDPQADTYLAVDRETHTVTLSKLTTGETLQTFALNPDYAYPRLLLLTPDGRYLQAWQGDHLVYWRVSDGQTVRDYDREVSDMRVFTTSPDGRSVAYLEGGRVLVVAANPVGPLAGDVNGSLVVDVTDAVLALRFVTDLDSPTAPERQAADVNGDAQLTISDVILILRLALGMGV